MKEMIKVDDYAKQITEALSKGILLNTNGDKFNAMVIGWGALGRVWNLPAFTIYVREHRYTKTQLDKTGEFTISIPTGNPDPKINQICGMQSGHNIDKVWEYERKAAGGRGDPTGESVSCRYRAVGISDRSSGISCRASSHSE